MTDDIKKLAAELVKSPHWQWMRGMSVRTTRTAGFPPTPAGTSVVLESAEDLDDHIVEGRFGAIAPEPHHSDPDFGAKSDLHDASVERARATAIPDLDDPLTARGIEVVLDEAYGECSIVGPWASPDGVGWVVHVEGGNDVLGSGPTRLAAVVAALLTPRRLAVIRSRVARAERLAAPTTTNKETP